MTRLATRLIPFGLAAIAFAVAAGAAEAGKKEEAAKHLAELKSKTATPAQKATALEELGKIGQVQKPLVAEATPVMIELLDSKDATIRAAAAKAVGQVDPDPKEVLPKLTKLMNDDKVEAVRLGAIAGIAAMGDGAKPALPDLRKLAKEGDGKSKVSRAAMTAVRGLMPKKQ